MNLVTSFKDGFKNVVANLGTRRDKAAAGHFTLDLISAEELLVIYRSSWIAEAIVDNPADDATRRWRKWQANADQITKIEALEKKFNLKQLTEEAIIAARLYGGAAIYINTGDSAQSEPLKAGTEIKSLVVLTCLVLTASETVKDIDSPYYGRPEYYKLSNGKNGTKIEIHASRLCIFVGKKLPANAAMTNPTNIGWGDSVIQAAWDSVRNAQSTMSNISSLVYEAKVDVFQMKGFAETLQKEGGDAIVLNRLHLMAAAKGINGAVLLDSEDSYEQKSASFGGLPEVSRIFQEDVAGASKQPVTRLYGRASAGLSGSGDGDERVYFDRIEKIQKNDISTALSHLDECLIYQALGSRPADIFYEWTPLRQLTSSERADIFTKTASAARAIAGTQAGEIIPLDALSDSLVNEITELGVLPGLDQNIKKYGNLSEQSVDSDDGDDADIGGGTIPGNNLSNGEVEQ